MEQGQEDRSCARESQGTSAPARAHGGGYLDDLALRFDRQVRFAAFGRAGQANLVSARVLVVGCGALGGVLAQTFFRAGVGELVLVDRDVVELSNLPRQVLFDERQARAGLPKALAARATLEASGGPTAVHSHVLHLDARKPHAVQNPTGVDRVHLVVDVVSNRAVRELINFGAEHVR